jgi:putative membrane protein
LIHDYTDHAANERTYLAWVRTALALAAFGLVVERFDLFARALPEATSAGAGGAASAAGLALIGLGVLVLGTASFRYLQFKRFIAAGEARDFRSSHTDLVLLGIVALIGLCLSIYVVAQALA